MDQSHEDIERLLEVLCIKGLQGEIINDNNVLPLNMGLDDGDNAALDVGGYEKRTQLGMYLAVQRQL
jgi:hypothetical protein